MNRRVNPTRIANMMDMERRVQAQKIKLAIIAAIALWLFWRGGLP